MFARKLSIRLKPNTLAEFTNMVENDIVPLLRKQPGFQDEITFSVPEGNYVLSISLWDTQKNAENYDSSVYEDVLKPLGAVIDGSPKVGITEVLHSTFSSDKDRHSSRVNPRAGFPLSGSGEPVQPRLLEYSSWRKGRI